VCFQSNSSFQTEKVEERGEINSHKSFMLALEILYFVRKMLEVLLNPPPPFGLGRESFATVVESIIHRIYLLSILK